MAKKIMVAEDDPGILDAMSQMLEGEGYEVVASVDAGIIEKIYDILPDLLLLDIWMSGVDGRDICRKLKNQEVTKHIPVIMVSANKDTKVIAKEAGADDYLAKPFEMDELLAMAEKYTR